MTTLAARLDSALRALDSAAGHVALREQAGAALRRAVGHDLGVWATLDPATVLQTSCVLVGAERDEALEAEVFAHEYADDPDVLRLADLAAGPLGDTVHRATGGDPSRSARHREALGPRGFSDHLRLVLSDGRTAWGELELLRATGVFTPEEVEAVTGAGRVLATVLRTAMLHTRATAPGGPGDTGDPVLLPLEVDGSGLVLCDRAGRPVEVAPEARALLGDGPLPPAIGALVARRRAGPAGPAAVHAPTATGRWLSFSATALGAHVAVVVDPIRPGRLADLVARARGLSAREQEVLAHLARGRSNKQIARAMGLSEWTVQDHVKAVLAKFGAAGRGELLAALFSGHYAGLHGSGS